MKLIYILVTAFLCSPAFFLNAAPRFNVGVAIDGGIAYQDSNNRKQFYYLPTRAGNNLFGDRITSFKASHFGMGKQYFVLDSNGQYKSRAGAILAVTASIDISDSQRSALISRISKVFSISKDQIALLPLPLRKSKVESILLDEIVGFGDQVQQKFPSSIAFGSEFSYSAGSLNSGFAGVVAGMNVNDYSITANPTFSLNISGEAEFVGEPWTAEVKCNLAQVWKDVRTSVSASVSYGWFRLGSAKYDSIAQDLEKSGACVFNMSEGSLDTEKYGRQVFDMIKKIFEEINSKASGGQGFFRFEPNPKAPPAQAGKTSTGLFGLSVSVNLGRSEASLEQSIEWSNRISYKGRFWHPIHASTVLAINCSEDSKRFFLDLGDASEPCITQEKVDMFMARAQFEKRAKDKKLLSLARKLENGSISHAAYEALLAFYSKTSITESFTNSEIKGLGDSLNSMGLSDSVIRKIQNSEISVGGSLTQSELEAIETEIIRSVGSK